MQAEGWKWIRAQKRDPYPRRVLFQTHWLRYAKAYWAHIDTVEDCAAPARIEAEVQDGGGLRVQIHNAGRFHLDLTKPLVGDVKEVPVAINGAAPLQVAAGKSAYFGKIDGKWAVSSERYPPGLVKKHGLSGPVMDVFMREPVLMVHGTLTSPDPAKSQKMTGCFGDTGCDTKFPDGRRQRRIADAGAAGGRIHAPGTGGPAAVSGGAEIGCPCRRSRTDWYRFAKLRATFFAISPLTCSAAGHNLASS